MILNDFKNRFRIGTVEKYHEVDAFYSRAFDAIIVGIPPMEDFYIGGASVKLFLPISR